MTISEIIKSRRSTRNFKETGIEDNIITELLEAARHAPSGGNSQNHVFGIIKDENIKEELAKAAGNQMWIAQAPVVFACCARLEKNFKERGDGDFGYIVNQTRWGSNLMEYIENYEDWKGIATLLANATPLISAEHIFLTAVSYGLSACFVGYLDIKKASEVLGLPEDMACLFLLPIGYRNDEPEDKYVKQVSEISFCDRYKKANFE